MVHNLWWFQTSGLFSIIYMGCHPSHWLSYFSRWLKPPTRYIYINGHFRNQCKGYVRGYTPKIWRYMVQYLHFRILEFPLMIVENHFRLAAWNHHFSGLPDPSCHTRKIWKVLIWGATSSIQWLVGSFKSFATWSTCIIMHLHAIPSNDEPNGLLMKETGD